MICAHCGGRVEWKGPLSNLTHTECLSCGGVNCQIPEEDYPVEEDVEPEPEVGLRPGYSPFDDPPEHHESFAG